jgi:uncharacterized protein (TIGR00369 family)
VPTPELPRRSTAESLNAASEGTLVGLIGLEIIEVDGPRVRSRLELREELLAPNGYLHAGTVITLADTTAGYGAWANLPETASGFTTIELKANFVGTTLAGTLLCDAELRHGGRSTQVWDATVRAGATGKTIALFRCTQLILYRGAPG